VETRVTAENVAIADLPPLPEGLFCLDCGYDLRGSTNARCPECGFSLELLRSGESQIPWSHRSELGRFRAYWKTVWLVIRWPKRICSEIARPVSYRDSQSFRWVTLLHAYLPILIASIAWVVFAHLQKLSGRETAYWVVAGAQISLLRALTLLPGLASYFYQPRWLSVEQQNRAIALSYYSWAPLAVAPAALVFFLAILVLWRPFGSTATDVLTVFTSGAYPLLIVLVYGHLNLVAKHILHQSRPRRFLRTTLLRVLSAALVFLLALVPLSLFYGLVIYYSLR
jgi:hypothetical protein